MAKSTSKVSVKSGTYKVMGETSDGVRVLSPKVRPTHFNATAAKAAVARALAGSDRAPGAVAKKG